MIEKKWNNSRDIYKRNSGKISEEKVHEDYFEILQVHLLLKPSNDTPENIPKKSLKNAGQYIYKNGEIIEIITAAFPGWTLK